MDRDGMKPDADGKYRLNVLLGTTEMSRPTGRWVAQEDGSLAMEMTDQITRDQNGVEVSRQPHVPFMTMKFDHFKPECGAAFSEPELFVISRRAPVLRTDGPSWMSKLLKQFAWLPR